MRLTFSSFKPKTSTERSRGYRARQAVAGGQCVTVMFDRETFWMLNNLTKARGKRRGGSKRAVIIEAIRALHGVA